MAVWGWPPGWIACRIGAHDWQGSPPTPRQKRDYCNATAQVYWLGVVPEKVWDRACLRCGKTELRVDDATAAAQAAYERKEQQNDEDWKRAIDNVENLTSRTEHAHARVAAARRKANGATPGRVSISDAEGGELSEADEHLGALSEFDARLEKS